MDKKRREVGVDLIEFFVLAKASFALDDDDFILICRHELAP